MGIIMLIGFITIGFFIFPDRHYPMLHNRIMLWNYKQRQIIHPMVIHRVIGRNHFFNLHLLRYTRNVKNYSPI